MNTKESPVGPMFDPPHAGEYLETVIVDGAGVRSVDLAAAVGVSKSTISRLLAGKSRLSADLAVRIELATGVSARLLLKIQDAHELWHARQTVETVAVRRLVLQSA